MHDSQDRLQTPKPSHGRRAPNFHRRYNQADQRHFGIDLAARSLWINHMRISILGIGIVLLALAAVASAQSGRPLATQAANSWIKHTPTEGSPVSPRLGYEGACVWDSKH